jgi:hypothetical protein
MKITIKPKEFIFSHFDVNLLEMTRVVRDSEIKANGVSDFTSVSNVQSKCETLVFDDELVYRENESEDLIRSLATPSEQ